MQGSYFHHLFLLCIWLSVKVPQLGCDAVSVSGQEDRAAANQCWQKCSLAANVTRSTAKAFESPETCYKECLKKSRSHQFTGNEQVRALSRRIKRDSRVSTNSTPISVVPGDDCVKFMKNYSYLPGKYIKVTLEYIPSGRGPPSFNASISWNVSSDFISNWTEGYIVLYQLQISIEEESKPICLRVPDMNARFTSFNITNKRLKNKFEIYVMVISFSQEGGPRNENEWGRAKFSMDALPPRVRTETTRGLQTSSPKTTRGLQTSSPKTTRDLETSSPKTTRDLETSSPKGTERKTLPTAIAIATCVMVTFVMVVVFIRWRFVDKKTKEEEASLLDSGFKFDAFIIYSTTDEKWVKNKLLLALEKKHNIKCCIHYRDFLPGVPFVENMAKSVYNSRKTIAVVSKSFLSSNYCNHELNIALHRLVERGDNSIIVIKLDDVEDSDLPIELQFRSYIDFTKATDRKTWEYKLVHSFRGERC
uniref:TIR1 n=1 Tax=Acropora millepora TaxID=45264 RepID=A0T396_ACRMI|nr:TIR1 [Acropora millepora]